MPLPHLRLDRVPNRPPSVPWQDYTAAAIGAEAVSAVVFLLFALAVLLVGMVAIWRVWHGDLD
jgi:hypothetical protein